MLIIFIRIASRDHNIRVAYGRILNKKKGFERDLAGKSLPNGQVSKYALLSGNQHHNHMYEI